MNNKTKMLLTSSAAGLLAALLAATAAAADGLLSPGLDVIAEDAGVVLSGQYEHDIYFSEQDFAEALGVDRVKRITIRSLPTGGKLKLGEKEVKTGDRVSRSKLSSLRFVPDGAPCEATFTFSVGKSGPGYTCTVFALENINGAPVITQPDAIDAGVFPGAGYIGTLSSVDPDGDTVKFEIISGPKHGTLSFTDASRGYFMYTPDEGYTGKDSFTARCTDKFGGRSNVVKQTLRVTKPTAAAFDDMDGHWANSAVLLCTGAGVFDEGGSFHPDEYVSRAEYLSVIMKAAGYDGFSVNTTGFADDAEIPESCRGEVAAAEAIGVVRGVERDGQLFFCPNNRITRAEAAVMLQRLTGSSSSDAQIAVFSDESVPAWARGAMSALAADGILRGDGSSFAPYREVTRAEAAQLASAVILRRAG